MARIQQTYGCIACGNIEQWDDIHWLNSHDGVCDKCYNKIPAFVKDYLCKASEEGMNDNQLELLIGSIRHNEAQISPKFCVGQEVWFIGEYKIERAKVERIEVRSEKSMNDLPYDKRPVYTNIAYTLAYQHGTIHEKRLFATKEDLIASL